MRGLSPGLGTMNVHVAHLAKKIPFIRRLVKERDSAVSGHSAAILERDTALAAQNSAVAERDTALAARDLRSQSATRHWRRETLRSQSATRHWRRERPRLPSATRHSQLETLRLQSATRHWRREILRSPSATRCSPHRPRNQPRRTLMPIRKPIIFWSIVSPAYLKKTYGGITNLHQAQDQEKTQIRLRWLFQHLRLSKK